MHPTEMTEAQCNGSRHRTLTFKEVTLHTRPAQSVMDTAIPASQTRHLHTENCSLQGLTHGQSPRVEAFWKSQNLLLKLRSRRKQASCLLLSRRLVPYCLPWPSFSAVINTTRNKRNIFRQKQRREASYSLNNEGRVMIMKRLNKAESKLKEMKHLTVKNELEFQ